VSDEKNLSLYDQRLRLQRGSVYDQLEGETQEPEEDYDYDEVLPGAPDLTRQPLNDVGNAERFLAIFLGEVRYCAELRLWLVWDGRRWRADNAAAEYLAKRAMKEFRHQAVDMIYRPELLKFAIQSSNVSRYRSLLQAAQSEPHVPVTISELDSHPFLLNVRNGTIDLETGQLGRHRRDDMLTQLIDVDYDPTAQAPHWNSVLREALEPDTIPYFKKALAYALSADTAEKAIFILFGKKDAGKSTLLSVMRGLLGDYATLLMIQTLTSHTRGSNALADLADLQGKRFAQTSELGDEKLVQRVLKSCVQGAGSEIKAVRKYANPIRFRETAKIFIDTNGLPPLADPYDEAFLSRVHLFYFAKTVPPEKIDRKLFEKLKNESSGILAELVQAFRRYRVEGLPKPPTVIDALNAWVANSDNTRRFIREACLADPRYSVQPQPLYEGYVNWCKHSHERSLSLTVFCQRLERQGFRRSRKHKGRSYAGIKLA
jgi:putative DNA primase/helicase